MRLRCECCGHEAKFKDDEEAFQGGWDEPGRGGFNHTLCPLCPGAHSYDPNFSHSKAHALWKSEGRPEEFTVEKCAGDGVIDNLSEIRRVNAGMKKVARLFKEHRRKEKNGYH